MNRRLHAKIDLAITSTIELSLVDYFQGPEISERLYRQLTGMQEWQRPMAYLSEHIAESAEALPVALDPYSVPSVNVGDLRVSRPVTSRNVRAIGIYGDWSEADFWDLAAEIPFIADVYDENSETLEHSMELRMKSLDRVKFKPGSMDVPLFA